MKKLIVLSFVFIAISNIQAQEVITLHGYLHVQPSDLGYFPERPSATLISSINRNAPYGFDDWRLPTRGEMALLFANQHIARGLTGERYITSDYHSEGNVRLVSTGKSVAVKRAEEAEQRRIVAQREEEQRRITEEQRQVAEQRRLAEERRVAEERRIAEQRAAEQRRLEEEQNRVGVVINGVRWATRNVGTSGIFASNIESYGGYFTFNQAQTACPSGWRVPTETEFHSLISSGSVWTTRNGVSGRLYGTAPNQIFLAATGSGDTGGGAGNRSGSQGEYLTSTSYSKRSTHTRGRQEMLQINIRLFFGSSSNQLSEYSVNIRASLRCVR